MSDPELIAKWRRICHERGLCEQDADALIEITSAVVDLAIKRAMREEQFATQIAAKVFSLMEAADDAREESARPVDQCPQCGKEGGMEYTSHGDAERKFACRGCKSRWSVEK